MNVSFPGDATSVVFYGVLERVREILMGRQMLTDASMVSLGTCTFETKFD